MFIGRKALDLLVEQSKVLADISASQQAMFVKFMEYQNACTEFINKLSSLTERVINNTK